MSRDIDSGKRSDESSTNAKSSFSCENCGQSFNSRQEFKEHSSSQH